MWWRKGAYITNFRNKKVFSVQDGKNIEGQYVYVMKRNNGRHQRWNIVYKDKAKKERTSGYDKEYGFHINRLFYFRSRLPMKRVAEAYSSYV
jgi:hypothetical protein